jgi:hypothetical protein
MRKANAICRLVEIAAEQATRSHVPSEPAAIGQPAVVELLTLGLD